jgi:hypothetical protein
LIFFRRVAVRESAEILSVRVRFPVAPGAAYWAVCALILACGVAGFTASALPIIGYMLGGITLIVVSYRRGFQAATAGRDRWLRHGLEVRPSASGSVVVVDGRTFPGGALRRVGVATAPAGKFGLHHTVCVVTGAGVLRIERSLAEPRALALAESLRQSLGLPAVESWFELPADVMVMWPPFLHVFGDTAMLMVAFFAAISPRLNPEGSWVGFAGASVVYVAWDRGLQQAVAWGLRDASRKALRRTFGVGPG